ncbi:MAG: hypothetical protein ABIS31_06000 [Candidatus Eisenbacteria bacterium]
MPERGCTSQPPSTTVCSLRSLCVTVTGFSFEEVHEMTGMVRKALTIAAGLAVTASVASAGVPDPRFSTTDLVVVGNVSGTAIGAPPPGFDVVVRDVNNAPLAGRTVTLDFSATPMKVYNAQNAGSTVNCPSKTISRVTNASGAVNFAARIAKFINTNGVEVSADGVVLALVKGRSTDIDGTDGTTGLGDFAIFGNNFLNNSAAQETDFDQSGTTALGDFAIFGSEFLGGASGTYCP